MTVREESNVTRLPAGGGFAGVTVGRVQLEGTRAQEYAVVRIQQPGNDRVCVAHPQWMDVATARAVGAALFELASEGTE